MPRNQWPDKIGIGGRMIPEYADGDYDMRRCHTAIIECGADAVIPIRRNGRAWHEDCPARSCAKRDPALNSAPRQDSLEEVGGLPCPKSGRGPDEPPEALRSADHLSRSRPPDRRNPDKHRNHELNRFAALDRVEIEAIALKRDGKGDRQPEQ